MPPKPANLEANLPLAPLTTFQLGGAARYFVRVGSEEHLVAALRWASSEGLDVAVLGGGSNLLVGDKGFDGLIVHLGGLRGVRWGDDGVLETAAGESWDAVAAAATERGWAGFECLGGIPGCVGATPIQNVGAYGQDVSETIEAVRVLDRSSLEAFDRSREECAFGYRDSDFKRRPGRFVVTSVRFRLNPGGPPKIAYRELERALAAETSDLSRVRQTVIALRRKKSMVVDPADPNHRSAGSFFTNPIVHSSQADELVQQAVSSGLVSESSAVPHYPAGDGKSKLAAAWLIERAGFAKGTNRGPVGLSTNHTLALVHRGGGSATALLDFAREIRDGVRARFGVTLVPEPRMLGCTWDE